MGRKEGIEREGRDTDWPDLQFSLRDATAAAVTLPLHSTPLDRPVLIKYLFQAVCFELLTQFVSPVSSHSPDSHVLSPQQLPTSHPCTPIIHYQG